MQLTKQALLEFGKQYNLSSIETSFRKQYIANIIIEYFINENIFDETASILIKEDVTHIFKLTELKYQFYLQKLQLEREKEELKLRKFQLEQEFKLRELEITNARSTTHVEHFDVTKYVRLVPTFSNQQVDSFFIF